MKQVILLVSLALSACQVPTISFQPVGATVAPVIPSDIRACPVAPEPAPIPPKPRTFEAVVTWANETEDRRAKTLQALEVCRHRLVELIEWAQAHSR